MLPSANSPLHRQTHLWHLPQPLPPGANRSDLQPRVPLCDVGSSGGSVSWAVVGIEGGGECRPPAQPCLCLGYRKQRRVGGALKGQTWTLPTTLSPRDTWLEPEGAPHSNGAARSRGRPSVVQSLASLWAVAGTPAGRGPSWTVYWTRGVHAPWRPPTCLQVGQVCMRPSWAAGGGGRGLGRQAFGA